MAELLVEFLSEEIPARMQTRVAQDLKRLAAAKLKNEELAYQSIATYATPRRLTLVVGGLPSVQPDRHEARKGPSLAAPNKAKLGFLGSLGLPHQPSVKILLEELCLRPVGREHAIEMTSRAAGTVSVWKESSPKGEHFSAATEIKGRNSADVLRDIIADLLKGLAWPKSMRFADDDLRWVRPLHRLIAVFDARIVPLAFSRKQNKGRWVWGENLQNLYPCEHPLVTSNMTVGHRFMAPEVFSVTNFADYKAKLRERFVMLDVDERQRTIAEQASALASRQGLRVRDDPGLLAEVAGLVEWPVALMGRIDANFLDLPAEVLAASMRTHQRFFAVETRDGTLAPHFIVVANIVADDGGAAIVAGNERVLRARLADAKFFWATDRKQSLASRAPALKDIVFHAKLGSLDEKADRLQALAVQIADHVPGADKDRVRSAARLAKADLTTKMVGEFPELQGIIGRYYALLDGEHEDVAAAIADHYAPAGPNDRCPTKPVSIAVALADRIDTLVGMFAIGAQPTGSKDPYALRRAALGIIRLITDNRIRLPLWTVFVNADQIYAGGVTEKLHPSVPLELLEFIADRLKVTLRESGVRHDLIDSIFSLESEDDLVRLLARVDALKDFLATDDGANLLIAHRRAGNIVRIEEKKDKSRYIGDAYDPEGAEGDEATLWEVLSKVEGDVGALVAAEEFAQAMALLALLRPPVDAFFDAVKVNVEDQKLRENRLRLLARITQIMNGMADFSKVQG